MSLGVQREIVIEKNKYRFLRFQVLTAASMKFRIVFWDVHSFLMMEAARTPETLVDNYFTRQYIPEVNSELRFF
jgi:hypothetical protein